MLHKFAILCVDAIPIYFPCSKYRVRKTMKGEEKSSESNFQFLENDEGFLIFDSQKFTRNANTVVCKGEMLRRTRPLQ
jgi:hypothetical protein